MSQIRDDQETVWVGAHNSRDTKIYHTNKDCMHLHTEPKTKPRESLDNFGYRECKTCAGESDKSPGLGDDARTPLRWRVDDE